ncbi:putative coil containing protein [Vibrio phage 150E35-1]|nr:putative coil containing protein [Vibrio phage 150E35-1]
MSTKLHEAALAAQSGTATDEQLDLLVQCTNPDLPRQYATREQRYLMDHLQGLYTDKHLSGELYTKLQMYFSTIDDDHAAWKETLIRVMRQPWSVIQQQLKKFIVI